jgi:predicted nucleotidyltransferase
MTPTSAEGCRPPAADAVLAKLRRHHADWQQRFHLVEIGVFGSVARGEQQPGSDIDIWVRLDPLIPYATIHLKQELETLLENTVDVVRLRERMNPALRQHILNEGLRA